jgi:glycerol-3-phosphate acyltransferase PlsY
MTTALVIPSGVLLGYLIGAIPFGYLIFYAARGIDIRTVGSGNIGATNVGRNLGFRYFLLVFALDVLKGFLPTFGLPSVMRALNIEPPADLPVFVAVAAILGHNFPVYLGFKGGKGVATSLGALLALDPIACGAAAVGFFLVFFLSRYVSLSSIAGGLAFVAGHFAFAAEPWKREKLAMSLMSIAIPALLIVRHHKNLARVMAGTEPKVSLRRKQDSESGGKGRPSGRVEPILVGALGVLTVGMASFASWVVRSSSTPIQVTAGPWALRETHRERTGQQRSTRVVFADRGRTLAVMCPRYNKVLVYRVNDLSALEPVAEIAVEGRPVAMAPVENRLVVLQRPAGDDKHLEPGWMEVFDLEGKRVGERIRAGSYPDDLAVTPDGRLLLVLCSGRAEGDAKKPLPGIDVYRGGLEAGTPTPIGRLDLEPGDDADRLVISASGTRALVTLPRAKQTVAIDLSHPEAPAAAGRTELASADAPYVSSSPDGDWIVMPTARESETVPLEQGALSSGKGKETSSVGYLICTRPDQSDLEIAQASPRVTLGQFPLKGPLNLGGTRPSGLAYSAERGLLAVATKPGTVHLIEVRSRVDTGGPRGSARQVASSSPGRERTVRE